METAITREVMKVTEKPEDDFPFTLPLPEMASNALLRAHDSADEVARLLDRSGICGTRSNLLRLCGPVEPKELEPVSKFAILGFLWVLLKPVLALGFIIMMFIVTARYLSLTNGDGRGNLASGGVGGRAEAEQFLNSGL